MLTRVDMTQVFIQITGRKNGMTLNWGPHPGITLEARSMKFQLVLVKTMSRKLVG